jgi:excisionase family DNA binding protein
VPTIKSLDEAAEITGVPRRTLQRWLEEGKLTPWTIEGDRRRFVDLDEIRRLREPRPAPRVGGRGEATQGDKPYVAACYIVEGRTSCPHCGAWVEVRGDGIVDVRCPACDRAFRVHISGRSRGESQSPDQPSP